MSETKDEGTTPTGVDLIARWPDQSHGYAATCGGCGEDVTTTGIVDLAYRYERCDCGDPGYVHIVERMWHLRCMRDAAPDLAATELLCRAAYALTDGTKGTHRRYTKGAIEEFLAAADSTREGES